jgi:hypothetical protein
VDRLQRRTVVAKRASKATDRLRKRIFVDHPPRPASFEQAVLVDVGRALGEQQRQDCGGGAVEVDSTAGDPQPAPEWDEFDIAEPLNAAFHTAPPMIANGMAGAPSASIDPDHRRSEKFRITERLPRPAGSRLAA